ncbi:MAG: hypothetical protein HC923_11800 [Myxococcales bacterium]|nr:hypothetical protein [Myxococcales bacterium]
MRDQSNPPEDPNVRAQVRLRGPRTRRLPDPNASGCFVAGEPECNGGVAGGDALCVVRIGQTEGECLCSTDDQCPAGAQCVGGDCCTGEVDTNRACAAGEGQVQGFCTCGDDGDCPPDSCNPTTSACLITGLPCTPGQNDCNAIACVEGLCFIGRNCAPEQGLSCSIVGD